MAESKDAAAIITAAVLSKMTLAPDADVLREAMVAFRKINRAVEAVDAKNEVIADRREKRLEEKSVDDSSNGKAALRRAARGGSQAPATGDLHERDGM